MADWLRRPGRRRSTEPEPDPADDPPPQRTEIEERRSERGRHHRERSGRYTADLYAAPVHQRAGDRWERIEPTLVTSSRAGCAWRPRRAPFAVDFAANAADPGTVRLAKGSWEVLFRPVGAQASTGEVADNVITYPAVWDRADLRYGVGLGQVGKEIVLHADPGVDRFRFRLGGNLRAVPKSSGGLDFIDDQARTVFSAPEPVMWESRDPDSPDPAGGATYIEIVFDRGWLTAPGRVFPVTIDPTITDRDAHFPFGRPAVNVLPQDQQRNRWSGWRGPFSPAGAEESRPLRFVWRLPQWGHRTRRFEPPATPLSGRLPDRYHEKRR